MDFARLFTEETGKQLPKRLVDFFKNEQYQPLQGKDVVKIFGSQLEDAGVEYSSAVLGNDFERMVLLSGWINDDGYYDEDIHVPIFTIKKQTTVCITMKVDDAEGKVYFFDKDTGFVDLEVTLNEFLNMF